MFAHVEPTILHADADAFFAAVAQRDDPELRGKPVVVGSWVVMAASYEARRYGIRGGMGGAKARRLCPHLVAVDTDFDAYTGASRALFDVFRETSPVVEGLSLEEAFLDVSGLGHILGTPMQIAERLRRECHERVGLAVTVGVASSKVVAKMASREAKPDGLKVVKPGQERQFLHPIPVEELWGVGKGTAPKLHAAGIQTVGTLARRSVGELASLLGPAQARQLHALANCRDLRRVRKGRARRSFGTQSALDGRRRSPDALDSILVRLVDRVTGRMRAKNRAGRTVVLRLRFRDYKRVSRSRTLPFPTAASRTVLASARLLMAEAMPAIRERGVTMVGVALTNIESGRGLQLELPVEPPHRPPVDAVFDEVRERFGSGVLRRASAMDSRLRKEGGAGLG
jgi:DNA polymerase IV